MKILLVTAPNGSETGLHYHRQLVPHFALSKHEGFEVDGTNTIDGMDWEQLQQFQIVHFLREVDMTWRGGSKYVIERLKRLGIKIVFDIDDYWRVDKKHLYSERYRVNDIPKQVEEILSLVDCVTTTTELMAEKIRPFNKNVHVLVNAIDPNEHQWNKVKIENGRVRLGWIGGVHHREDLSLMSYGIDKINSFAGLRDKFQFCLGGFNVAVNFTDENEKQLAALGFNIELLKTMNFKEMVQYFISKNVAPPVPEFINLERIMTSDHKHLKQDRGYFEYLNQFTRSMEHITFDKPYRRLWGLDVWSYGQLYNEIDVALVPLVNNTFNNCKSQLKIIEAGFMNKACIVSNVHPYTIDCNNYNSLLVANGDKSVGWYQSMKRMIDEPNLRQDLADALTAHVVKHYHIDVPTEIRKQIYINLIK